MKNFIKIVFAALLALNFPGCTKERFLDEPGNLVPKTVDQDPSLPSINVNGAQLHSEAFGHPDSTMIVVIHGGPGSDYRHLYNCRDLSNYGYRVVFYDQRGSGLSQRFSKKSYTSLGEGVLDVLYNELTGVINHYRTHEQQKVYLLGHSWGAMMASAYIGKYPTAVQGVVLCEPGGLKWDDIMEYVKESRSFGFFTETLNDATYIDQFATGKEDEHEILDYKMALRGASDNPVTGDTYDKNTPLFWRFGAVINMAMEEVGAKHKPDFSAGVSNFALPVMFFYSEKNKAYPTSWAQKISGAFNNVSLYRVPGCGHDGIIYNRQAWTSHTLPRMLDYFNSL